MATTKQVAAPRKRAALPATTNLKDSAAIVERTEGADIALVDVKVQEEASATAQEEWVTAIVPTRFTLTLDSHKPVEYEAGVQEMPLSHASHWFARARGVKVYTPSSKD